MRFFILLLVIVTLATCQNGGIAKMQELRTNIDPVRTFDLPEEAPRARVISTDFLGNKRQKKKVQIMVKDNGVGMEEFRRWRLSDLTDREMRSSTEVKKSVKSPFSRNSEENIGEFFPTRIRL